MKTVLEFFENHPERWAQGDFGSVESGGACLFQAIEDVHGDTAGEALEKVSTILGKVFITGWNDDPERTHADIVEVCRKAGI